MLAQSMRASRSTLARVARQQSATLSRRTLMTPTAIRSAELVQDLYLRELKNYKIPPTKASDSDGHVLKFALPKAPPSPEEANLANDLQSYETQSVDLEGSASSTEGTAEPVEQDWFEEEEEEAPAHH